MKERTSASRKSDVTRQLNEDIEYAETVALISPQLLSRSLQRLFRPPRNRRQAPQRLPTRASSASIPREHSPMTTPAEAEVKRSALFRSRGKAHHQTSHRNPLLHSSTASPNTPTLPNPHLNPTPAPKFTPPAAVGSAFVEIT